MNRKGFAPIIMLFIVVGVLIVGGAIWYLVESQKTIQSMPATLSLSSSTNNSPVPTPIPKQASWERYMSKPFRFSIQYPKVASVTTSTLPDGFQVEHRDDLVQETLAVHFIQNSSVDKLLQFHQSTSSETLFDLVDPRVLTIYCNNYFMGCGGGNNYPSSIEDIQGSWDLTSPTTIADKKTLTFIQRGLHGGGYSYYFVNINGGTMMLVYTREISLCNMAPSPCEGDDYEEYFPDGVINTIQFQ